MDTTTTTTTTYLPDGGPATAADGLPNPPGRARALLGRLAGALLPVLRPALPLALALAYFTTLWLQLLHYVSGFTEHNEPSGLLHWLRDATLVLPVILVAVVAALFLVRRLLQRVGHTTTRFERDAIAVTATAVAASTAVALSSPLHGLLFAGHGSAAHGGLPLVLHLVDDGLLALVASLPVAAAVWTLVGRRFRRDLPGRRPLKPRILKDSARRAAVNGLVALSLVPSLLGLSPATPAPGLITPATNLDVAACLSGGNVALKHFDVQAIDVDIPLNRFGDHDPFGKMLVLSQDLDAVRAAEQSREISLGLRYDPIQPLVIRANMGDCVEIQFTNNASGGDYGLHIDGLAFDAASSGDAIGLNPQSAVARGASRTYRYWVPNDPTLEGAHYMRPGPGNRFAVNHGLFGALVVEPAGSVYLSTTDNQPIDSGWEATIVPAGKAAFRENIKIFHEIGDETEEVYDKDNKALPLIDPQTEAYRPGSRALNYRSESFMRRLEAAEDQKSVTYSAYVFGDTTDIIPRGYLGDPTKFRILHASGEVFHVYHLHGGSIRWRFNPHADPSYNYADTGLNKRPESVQGQSARLDAQNLGPGESYDLEIEGGAGGRQQGAGEFLFHCHIAHHYFAGMWGYWRVFDTLQPDLAPLPDRSPLSAAVDSASLIGKTMPDGTTLTQDNLDEWIRIQLPPQGVTQGRQDASVWDWTIDTSNPERPLYLGEPDDSSGPWFNDVNAIPGHPRALKVDRYLPGGDRPLILFNPHNGRPTFPLIRTHVGKRPPFAPYGHSGAPWLGEDGGAAKTHDVDPWSNRADGLCPAGATLRTYNVTSIGLPIQVTKSGLTDKGGALYVLVENKDKVRNGTMPQEPLALRGNIGDCIALTYVTELTDDNPELHNFTKTNIHIHHLQFDTQSSDGVITGYSYEQSIRPYKIEDVALEQAVQAGDLTLVLSHPNDPTKTVAKYQVGTWIAVGMGTNAIELHQVAAVDPAARTLTLTEPLRHAHAAGQWAGVEYVQYRWYPDVELDQIFYHDHVNGIHGWSHGMVGMFITEPEGSTYHDPRTGAEVRSGALVDIRTDSPMIPGLVDGSFRELALWTIDNHAVSKPKSPQGGSTFNLKAEPWEDRGGDPSLRFSSYVHGDPYTPLPRAYVGDPLVIKTINVSQGMNTLHIDGHRVYEEPRFVQHGRPTASPIETLHNGISEKHTLVLEGGAGGLTHQPGDYLYNDGVGRAFKQGAWGIIRVLPSPVGDLQPLPAPGTISLRRGHGGGEPAEDHAAPAETSGTSGKSGSNTSGSSGKSKSGSSGSNTSGSNTSGSTAPTAGSTPATGTTPVAGTTPTVIPVTPVTPVVTGKTTARPPEPANPGNPCLAGAPLRSFKVSAIDLPSSAAGGGKAGRKAAFIPSDPATVTAVKSGAILPEPLVLHAAEGECVTVHFSNLRQGERASFHLGALLHDPASSGITIGYGPEQTVAPGGSRTYKYYADTVRLESALIADFGGADRGKDGLYGALVVAPRGASFSDPLTGRATSVGTQVDVQVPGTPGYRDFTLLFADTDPVIGQNAMPYPKAVSGPALINYLQVAKRPLDAWSFSSLRHGDPQTPLLRAYAGDLVKVHVIGTPGSEQLHVFNLGGQTWPLDPYIIKASQMQSRAFGPWEKLDAIITGGAGGPAKIAADFFYGDLRRPFTEAGMWGIMRVLPAPAPEQCPRSTATAAGTLRCLGQ